MNLKYLFCQNTSKKSEDLFVLQIAALGAMLTTIGDLLAFYSAIKAIEDTES